MWKFWVSQSLLFILCGCGIGLAVSASTGYADTNYQGVLSSIVINGVGQPETSAPQMVRLEIALKSGKIGGCSGVIIAPGRVLTAAHCVVSVSANALTVFNRKAAYSVTRIDRAPGYRISITTNAVFNDAAVLVVRGLTAPALPIVVNERVSLASNLKVFGFGQDQNGETGRLRYGVTSASAVTQNHIFGAVFTGKNVNPCFGDSGGPLIISAPSTKQLRSKASITTTGIVAIVSSGTNSDIECHKGDVTLYTNLQNPQVLKFIKRVAPRVVIK